MGERRKNSILTTEIEIKSLSQSPITNIWGLFDIVCGVQGLIINMVSKSL